MTRDEEYQKLKVNSPWALPFNPSEEGWTAAQIKEKFWKGLIVLLDIINSDRDALETKLSLIDSMFDDLNSVSKIMPRAVADDEGNTIKSTYVKIQSLTSGVIASLKYIKENGQTGNISDLETAVNTVRNNLESFISSMFTGDKAKKAIDADFADRATKDIDGNPIKTTYAKQSALDIVAALITALTNGNSVVDKARKDQDGNRIDTTYVKISNISNVLNDTSTDKPLSAAQGKALKDALDTLSNYIYNGAANTSIDRLAEIFAFLTGHDDDETLDGILAGKVSIADIVDNLTTNNASKAVSAKQAYILKGLIDELVSGKADDFSVSSSELEDIFTDPVEEEEENE